MEIEMGGFDCIAVSQGVVYAVVTGFQPDGGDGTLLTLIKTEHPATANGNNTWSIISATPSGYFGRNGPVDCDVDKNGVFTMRLENGAGYRYDPLASKVPRAQTCSSDGNGLGEWKRVDLVGPDEVNSWRRLILQPDIIPSVDNKSNSMQIEGDEMVIYYPHRRQYALPIIQYAWINKKTCLNILTDNDTTHTYLSKNLAAIEILQYGNGQIFSVLASGPSIAVPNTERNANRTAYNKTLVYFPFEAPFHLTSLPSSAISVPWNVDCDGYDAFSAAVVAKSKFYYVCAALGSTPKNVKIVMYIYDSEIRQTQGPFSLRNNTLSMPLLSTIVRLTPVYSAAEHNVPEFLIVQWFPSYITQSIPSAINLRALNNISSETAWSSFFLPKDIPMGTDLNPSCRNREARKKLTIAGVVSGVFVIVMLVFLCIWRRRKRRSKVKDADQNSSQIAQDEELELGDRSKDAKAPIQDDA